MTRDTVDVHSHAVVPGGPTAIGAWYPAIELRSDGAMLRFPDGNDRLLPPSSHRAEPRVEWMDSVGIGVQVLSPAPNTLAEFVDGAAALDVARHINDGLADLAASPAHRFVALGTLPAQRPNDALTELSRCVTDLGLIGVELSTAAVLDGAAEGWLPALLDAAAQQQALVFVHPHDRTVSSRRNLSGMAHTLGIGMPSELALAGWELAKLLVEGPAPQVVLAHGGGTLPWLLARLEALWKVGLLVDAPLGGPTFAVTRTLHVDSLTFGDEQLEALLQILGEDRVLFGSDFPAPFAEVPIPRTPAHDGRDCLDAMLRLNARRLGIGMHRSASHRRRLSAAERNDDALASGERVGRT